MATLYSRALPPSICSPAASWTGRGPEHNQPSPPTTRQHLRQCRRPAKQLCLWAPVVRTRAAASPGGEPPSSGASNGSGNGGSSGSGGGGGGGGGRPSPEDSFGRDGFPIFLLCMASGVLVSLASRARQGSPVPAGGQPASSSASSSSSSSSSKEACPASVSVIVPALNEEKCIGTTLRYLKSMSPAPTEIIVVDGGSSDGTVRAARQEGAKVVRSKLRGRGAQMNAGADAAKGDILVFVHADTRPPASLVPTVRTALSDPHVVIGGFNTVMEHEGRPLRYLTAFHFLKTYATPLFFRPLSLARGLRCLFGDQTLFCRAADFRRVGGYDGRLPIMEDIDLVVRLHNAGPGGGLPGRGKVLHLLRPLNVTSGRRLGPWGNLRSTYVSWRISLAWYFGAPPERLKQLYNELWTDQPR